MKYKCSIYFWDITFLVTFEETYLGGTVTHSISENDCIAKHKWYAFFNCHIKQFLLNLYDIVQNESFYYQFLSESETSIGFWLTFVGRVFNSFSYRGC